MEELLRGKAENYIENEINPTIIEALEYIYWINRFEF